MACACAVWSRLVDIRFENFECQGPIIGLTSTPLVTLDEALRFVPLDPKEFIRSRLTCSAGECGGLSIDEQRAIQMYTSDVQIAQKSFAELLNGSLRGCNGYNVEFFLHFLKLFNGALAKKSTQPDDALWCGVDCDLYNRYVSNIGKVIVFWGYTSTTTKMMTLDEFFPSKLSHRTLFSIRVKSAAELSHLSTDSEDKEMLIMPSTVFKVQNVFRKSEQLTIVVLEEVDNLLNTSRIPAKKAVGLKHEMDFGLALDGPADVEAIYQEGYRYEEGQGTKDDRRARECYEAAAMRGHAAAQAKLGEFIIDGRGGVKQSYTAAMRYFKAAAEQGDAVGQFWLGSCHFHGHGGLTQDEQEGVSWWRRAAAQGHAWAQYNLGWRHAEGRGGLIKDMDEAVRLLRLAAGQDHDISAQESALHERMPQ